MTDCTAKVFSFSPLSRKKITAQFSGGSITSNAGIVLLREVNKKLSLSKQLAACIQDLRDPSRIDHSYESMLMQRIYGIACGYEDLNDHDALRQDQCFQIACDRNEPLSSSPTLCRMENNFTREDCARVSQLLVELFIQCHKKAPDELILDFDATDDPAHGEQECNFFNGFYDEYCFLPLYVFCGSHLLVSYLRPSNIDGAKHSWGILSLLVKRLREKWPQVKITFRGDSGFCRDRMLTWCDHHDVEYIVGIPGNNRLVRAIESDITATEAAFKQTNLLQRRFVQFEYAAESWTIKRTVVARIQYDHHGQSIRFITTNKPGHAQKHYEARYSLRGDMENKIKQQKLDLGSGRTSCKRFIANQMRLLFSSLAYVIIHALQTMTLKRTNLRTAYVGTIRNKLLKIGAVIIVNTRRIKILFDSHCPLQDLFITIAAKLTAT